jgi:hypothetical protein
MFDTLLEVKSKKELYYTLVDCCSGESYVYPQGHYLAGYAMYVVYNGIANGYTPGDIINPAEIITSITDSLGFTVSGCLILKPSTPPPTENPPINLQNWADVFYQNLNTTSLCCDCNSACNSLFFQFVNPFVIDFGQLIFPFVGPTGNYNGRNYYQIVVNAEFIFYVWYSTQDQVWYVSDVLGDETTMFGVLNTTNQIPAFENRITTWENEGDETSFQSYICNAPAVKPIPSSYKFPEEKYQLTCCVNGEALKINGLPAIFVFQGKVFNENHPDNFLEVVLTTIKDINGNYITGCFRVTEADCYEEWEEILWHDFFIETECVSTCQECLPKPVIIPAITDHKIIYPDYVVNNVDSGKAEQIFCAFGDANYEKVLALRYGIQFCCPTDLMQSTIEHEILKMDIAEDLNACCPDELIPSTCKKYTVTIPNGIEGYLYFKDCSNVVRTVMFHQASSPYNVFVCGVTLQTSANIYVLANNSSIIQVAFTEGVDCN